jgi:hypothetical protein
MELEIMPGEVSQSPQGDTEGTHGIPDPNELDGCIFAAAKTEIRPEFHRFRVVWADIMIPVQANRIPVMLNKLPPEYPAFANHPGNTTGSKGPAAETKQENLIPKFVIGHQKPIGIMDVCFKPIAKSATGSLVERVPCPNSLVVKDDLSGIAIPLGDPVDS